MSEPTELTPDEIAAEFNRRKWRGREDWKVGEISSNDPDQIRSYLYSEGSYSDDLDYSDWDEEDAPIRILPETAQALVAGWKAQEELARVYAYVGVGFLDEGTGPQVLVTLIDKLATLTAERDSPRPRRANEEPGIASAVVLRGQAYDGKKSK